MTSKKIKELGGLNESELKKKIEDLKKELMKLNAQVATGTMPKSPGLIKSTKKTIAMILTLLRKKEIEGIVNTKKEARSEKTQRLTIKKASKEVKRANE